MEWWNSGTVERWNGSTFSTCTRKVQLLYIYTYIADQVKVFIVPRILTWAFQMSFYLVPTIQSIHWILWVEMHSNGQTSNNWEWFVTRKWNFKVERFHCGTVERWNSGTVERWNSSPLQLAPEECNYYIYIYVSYTYSKPFFFSVSLI